MQDDGIIRAHGDDQTMLFARVELELEFPKFVGGRASHCFLSAEQIDREARSPPTRLTAANDLTGPLIKPVGFE